MEPQQQSEAGDNKLKIHKSSQHLPESPQSPLCSASVVVSGLDRAPGPGLQCGQRWYAENLDFCLLVSHLPGIGWDRMG